MKDRDGSSTPSAEGAECQCADDEAGLVEFGEFGAMPECGATGAEDEIEGVAAAVEEEIDGGAEAAGELVDEGLAFGEKQIGAFDELAEAEYVRETCFRVAWAVHPVAEFGFGALKIVQRDVDAVALDEVAPDILPEIGELEGGADAVRQAEEFWMLLGRVAIEHEDDSPDGVRAAGAVIEELIPGFVAGDALVLLESENQIFKWGEREVFGADRFT